MATGTAKSDGAKICVLVNATSGTVQRQGGYDRLRDALDRHPGHFVLRRIDSSGGPIAATEAAMADGFSTIVAAGGDGTVNAVAGRLMNTGHTMGVLPMGTFNYFSRSLGMPDDLDAAAQALIDGTAIRVSPGEVNGQIFLNNASIGVYAQILDNRERDYKHWGRSQLVAYWSLAATMLKFTRPLSLRLIVDGDRRDRRVALAFISLSAFQLESFNIEGADEVRQGKFAVMVGVGATRMKLLTATARLAMGMARPGEDVEIVFGRDVVIETAGRRRLVAFDGERKRMRTPLRFRLHDDALSVVKPLDEPAG